MFNDNLGFNPFSNDNNVFANGHTIERNRFLNSFKQNNIFCYNGNPRKKISNMNHTDTLDEAVNANINNNSDVYFYVNGGRKLYAIREFTCCFCDMDAGRDNEGKYFKPSVVMTKKKEFLKKINEFPVKPSWVVDTRNGYQCYWIFNESSRQMIGSNKTFWNGLQKKLVNYFGGDPRAIKPNQIYRVPYTWWRKCWEKKAPYFTSLLPGSTGQTINVADLKSALTGQPATLQIIADKCSDEWYKGYAKAYKQADETGIPVPADVASKILNELNNQNADYCGQKNTKDSVWGDFHKKLDNKYGEYKCNKSFGNNYQKAYGDPMPVMPISDDDTDTLQPLSDEDINLDGSQTKLLKTVVEYLNQASTALYFSNNRFLASAAKDLASQLSDKFCIG